MSNDAETLLVRLRGGDAGAFAELVDQHGPSMLRVVRDYVATREQAEDVVQETWVAVLRGIDRFEGRSSLRTWIFSILINIAKRQGMAERRYAATAARVATGRTVDPTRFRDFGDALPGHWKEPPAPFPDTPEGSLLSHELLNVANTGLARLPERQREVVRLRDVLGFSAEEVSSMLEISAGNQRVLLHRGRAAVRQELEDYLGARP
ncbi:RNA polymerase subunit sigma-24 [Mycobacterium gordonae]|jgi:RNA polymerase sigma-70 factor (ECF subfamily)|uniref:RNA polymerase subunit sigma-24 n=1 Tax=Mycobacterium gordonae TaxID=1778 RepID=A0A1A6B873_MYCGO|nr:MULTISPECIES: sigma-70 family RNA polymerase sigma factor [Mycobacterium]MBI2701714.1 sigma-70 family RNA polymerase sigma factor [Mycobacterium sp.]OBR98546.1 RNA polymerase subunit sigma-24 [Mycobacterium gordonae]PJE16398.1 MAG: RNA polymerase subunit sigma-24 [Mycobacterium sp.]